ncbi:hypothetical protein ABT150_23255 [Streptomyces mirabilis]|uniref:hypothetical protein n=1 Tax=Streptomyces mirabilis TaxID=68239 RepID=UPI00331EC9A9
MTVSQGCAMPERPELTPAHVLDTPLPRLLAETGVELFDSTITDSGFCGAVVQRKKGGILLAMPTGRSQIETDTVARYLIAQVFDVDLSELPPPFTTTEL